MIRSGKRREKKPKGGEVFSWGIVKGKNHRTQKTSKQSEKRRNGGGRSEHRKQTVDSSIPQERTEDRSRFGSGFFSAV